MHSKGILSTAFVAAMFAACAPRQYNSNALGKYDPIVLDTATQESMGHVSPMAGETWRYWRAEAPQTLQSGCEPAQYSPPQGVRYRGVAILLHGYSACPQQYDQLGPQLARAGYEVFVPLFPGHGLPPVTTSPRIDNVEFVPRVAQGWGATVAHINDFAKMFQGEKVLIGLSMGANLALRAYQTAPNLYSKIVAVSPKLRNEVSTFSSLFSNPVHVLGVDEFLLNMRSGWEQCASDSLPPGNRAGFCNFENRNAIAMLDFGGIVIKQASEQAQKNVENKTPVQFILSQADNGTCNQAAEEVLTNIHSVGNVAKACIMPKDVPHSMFSVHDSPFAKPWNKPLFNSIETFVTKGEFVPGSQNDVANCAITW